MVTLACSVQQWPSDLFKGVLKRELESLPAGTLPLGRAVYRGGFVYDNAVSVTVIDACEADRHIKARIGVFFTEILSGCSCGDDPSPENAYCEMLVRISKSTAEADFELLLD